MAVKLVSSTKIYLDARKLLDIILDIVPNFPRAYKFTIGAKLQEIGVNLMQEIAAAYINKDKSETVKHLTEFQVDRLNKAKNIKEVKQSVCSINSYLGFMRHANEYANRKKILETIGHNVFKWIYIRGHFESIAIKKRYHKRSITLRKIGYGKQNRRSRSDNNNKRCGCKPDKVVVEKVDSGS